MDTSRRRSTGTWIGFGLLLLIIVCLFMVPAFIIRPFRYQSPGALTWALRLRHYGPIGTIVLVVPLLLLAGRLWTRGTRGQKAGLAAGLLLAIGSTTMARLNYFEWMFHPVRQAGFEEASRSQLDANEMALTVTFNNDARAYPIREMAYHHILNDVVGGVPVAVTY
jgi:uncharacterized protein DUF3179